MFPPGGFARARALSQTAAKGRRKVGRRSSTGRPTGAGRNTVERCTNLSEQNRAVATRWEERAAIFDGTVLVGSRSPRSGSGSAVSPVHRTGPGSVATPR